jgi:hypothetical protein
MTGALSPPLCLLDASLLPMKYHPHLEDHLTCMKKYSALLRIHLFAARILSLTLQLQAENNAQNIWESS